MGDVWSQVGDMVFPAQAGVIQTLSRWHAVMSNTPRKSGGDPEVVNMTITMTPYSPHMRG